VISKAFLIAKHSLKRAACCKHRTSTLCNKTRHNKQNVEYRDWMSTFDKSVDTQQPVLTSFKTIFFALIEKISLGRSQLHGRPETFRSSLITALTRSKQAKFVATDTIGNKLTLTIFGHPSLCTTKHTRSRLCLACTKSLSQRLRHSNLGSHIYMSGSLGTAGMCNASFNIGRASDCRRFDRSIGGKRERIVCQRTSFSCTVHSCVQCRHRY
jgi:hypothetical protein